MAHCNLDIDSYGGKSVVPVSCDKDKGTAFFINRTQLLTAAHVVSSALCKQKKPVYISVLDSKDPIVCTAEYVLYGYDVAILTCLNYVLPEEIDPIPLLLSKFHEGIELEIIGYPMEIGNGTDYFGMEVRTKSLLQVEEKLDYDTIVVRNEPYLFYSYAGFSGSPVLNEFGYAVGVETDQMDRVLGYVSLKNVQTQLENVADAKVIVNDNLYDTTTYGLGTCKRLMKESVRKAGNRFDRTFHIENKGVESQIKAFCNVGVQETHKGICEQLKNLLERKQSELSNLQHSFSYDKTKKLLNEFIADGTNATLLAIELNEQLWMRNGDQLNVRGKWRRVVKELSKSIGVYGKLRDAKSSKYAYINAKAGCGKTHILCKVCIEISTQQHVYLMYGTDFKRNTDPCRSICDYYGWEEDGLQKLSNKLERGEYATFIIDAINEGEGTQYWTNYIQTLKDEFNKYSNLKLLISVRSSKEADTLAANLNNWFKIELNGHDNVQNAIIESFEHYKIPTKQIEYTRIPEFENPLFLSIFCKGYRFLTKDERENPTRDVIYMRYLDSRNHGVSEIAEEDPCSDATSRYLKALARLSVNNYKCGDLPREHAKKKSYQICHYRTWRNSLLRAMLHENLLMEYSIKDFGNRIAFEYDSMGDYLRSQSLLELKKEEADIVDILAKNTTFYQSNINHPDYEHYYNFLITFLSEWKPQRDTWRHPAFMGGVLSAPLIMSMEYRKTIESVDMIPDDVILESLKTYKEYRNPETIILNFGVFASSLMSKVNDELKSMTINERDYKWSRLVNNKYDRGLFDEHLEHVNWYADKHPEAVLMLFAWLLTSSYQIVRAIIVRRTKTLFDANPNLIKRAIELYHDVNDPYVMEGLLCAAYGSLLKSRNDYLSHEVAESLYFCYAINQDNWPSNVIIRQWICSIFQFAEHLNPAYKVWSDNIAALRTTWNINLLEEAETAVREDEGYLGYGRGARKIEDSLYHLDFYRYVLHGNWSDKSQTFYYKAVKDHPIELPKIAKAIEFVIKNNIGWTSDLDLIDGFHSGGVNSYDQTRERIGKKYQWLGLYEVVGYLCDNYHVWSHKFWDGNGEFVKYPFTWHTGYRSRFDATLDDASVLGDEHGKLFDEKTAAVPKIEDARLWANNAVIIPVVEFLHTDKNGEKWLALNSYNSISFNKDLINCSESVWIQGYFVKAEDIATMRDFISKHREAAENYMQNSGGVFDFFWGEYPWHDAYKMLDYEQSVAREHGCPCELYAATTSQLQEDDMALDSVSDVLYEAIVPSETLMRILDLHTAERGVIRRMRENVSEIVALNLKKSGLHSQRGLIIRRSVLDDFLSNGYGLFLMVKGYRNAVVFPATVGENRFEGFYYYNSESKEVEPIIQMRVEVNPTREII